MKSKLPLVIFLTVGTIAGFLIIALSPPSKKSSSLPDAQKQIRSRVAPKPDSEPLSSVASKVGTRLSTSDKVRELVAKIEDALKAEDSVDQRLAFGDLLRDLIEEDPLSAARLAGSQGGGPGREEMMRRVAQYWAQRDASGARQWAEGLTNEGERNAALTDVCFQMAQADPRQATLLANDYGLGELPGAPLENLVMQWAVKDLNSVTAWVKELPEGEQKDNMLARVAMVMAKTSPAEAAEMVATQLPEGAAQTESVISVIHQWAINDLPAARAWTELFPDGPLRERALGELNGIEQYQHAPGHRGQ